MVFVFFLFPFTMIPLLLLDYISPKTSEVEFQKFPHYRGVCSVLNLWYLVFI